MIDLPAGWCATKLENLGEWSSGGTPSRTIAAYFGGDIPWVKTGDLKHELINEVEEAITDAGLKNSAAKVFPKGTLLVAMYGATIGQTGILKFNAATNQACAALLANGTTTDVIPYVWRYIISQQGNLKAIGQGGAQPNISQTILKDFPISIAPLPEQRRIVAKTDGLSARSRRARDHLDHIPRLVEKYKQAILAAAFRGELTREWRSIDPSRDTPADRIEQLRLERERIAGKPFNRKVSDDNGRIPVQMGELPASWARTTLEAVTSPQRLIQYGILKPGPHVQGGVPYVKVMNIRGGRVHLEHIRCTTPDIAEQYRRAAIVTGDILLTIRGTVGRLALVPEELSGGNITQDSVRIAVLDCVERDYVFLYLHSPSVQQYFAVNQKGVAVRGINVGDVRPIEMPLPPRGEQQELVRRVNVALAWVDRLASEATSARKLIDHLDQAILAKAFRGELVPQDPNDEPASVLLERIAAERHGPPKIERRRRAKAET